MKNQAECFYPSTILTTFKKALFVTAVIIGIILVARPTVAGPADDTVVVRLDQEAYAQAVHIDTVHTIDYGTFVWLELTQSGFAQLQAQGVEFERQRNPGDFQIQGQTIDPGTALTSTLSAQITVGISVPNFYLVQLLGPAKDQWISQLENSGVEILQYLDPYVHMVRMPSGNVAAVAAMDFVRWVNPYLPQYRISSDLLGYTGIISNVDVTIYNPPKTGIDGTLAAITSYGGTLVERETGNGNDMFLTATFRLPASALDPVAQLGEVAWLSYRPPVDELEDEMSDQIIAGNFGPINPGYQNWLTGNGVNGTGVTVALIDSGYDTGVDATSHPDLSGRLIPVGTPTDTSGHGTHVGGIIAGNASLGTLDGSNFLLGLGVAPAANLVVRRFTGTDAARQMDAVTNGAVASNNSYAIHTAGIGYTSRDRTLDMLVRDADQTTAAVAEPLSMIFSAGNSGTTGPTKEAKNIIAVANSLNQRTNTGAVNTSTNINTLRGSSSRGPAGDGRVYPHVTAPGTNIVSTGSSQPPVLTNCTTIATGAGAPAANPTYNMCTGTSMAAPHVTGAVALITEWWRGFNGGANPSPAMAKSLLVNGAVDMGTADIPNGNEGWGRINLSNVINTGIATEYVDQTTVFNNTGNTWSRSYSPANPGQQVKVTVAWSDAPGPGTGGNPAALVNDLDLTVNDPANTFLGNDFANGLSTTGGAADTIDNLENVFIQNPADAFTVTVTGAGINGDGVPYNGDTTDQDFALVCSNCIPNNPPVCDANGPYTAECSLNTSLDGSGSSDLDGDPLNFQWTGPFQGGTASGVTPSVVFPEPTGLKSVTLDVDDGLATRSCSAAVTVQDTLDPSIAAPADKTAECASPAGTAVALGTPTVSDICDASVDVSNDAPALFPLGMTTVTWTAMDDSGNQDMAAQKVTIQDTIPPDLTLSVTPSVLWPPNHKLVTVNANITVSDVCDANPVVTLVSITSNEPDNGIGDGDTVNDIQGAAFGTDDREFQLRSERSGKGNGRIYTITYEASDASGNVTTRQATVTVPHDLSS